MSQDKECEAWKVGNEFAPYHPDASHVDPQYRDGWNACYRAALASQQAVKGEPVAWMYRVFSTVHFHEKRLDHYYNDGKDYIKGEPLTDEQIERAFESAGGRWNGSQWVIEDADLHPFVRGIHSREGGSNG